MSIEFDPSFWLVCSDIHVSSKNVCPSSSTRPNYRVPNLTFGKLPLGKLHIWEIVTWEVALRKLLWGKYLTPYNVQCTMFYVQCTMYIVETTICTIYTMYNVQCTMYTPIYRIILCFLLGARI